MRGRILNEKEKKKNMKEKNGAKGTAEHVMLFPLLNAQWYVSFGSETRTEGAGFRQGGRGRTSIGGEGIERGKGVILCQDTIR